MDASAPGFTLDEYLRCVDLYDRVGIDLTLEKVVGLGSICRRQNTKEAVRIVESLSAMGTGLGGFDFKITGLRRVAHLPYSS
ncbi:deazapurine DNA modification protein DpdA family protein [Streptomyces smyrnaeus]|uniref:deazapurine DNA modification protein DpdA family protein n=1 Tax=Streptomyces smyrnaeus TaxID=1387713 RepID=UPI0033CE6E44